MRSCEVYDNSVSGSLQEKKVSRVKLSSRFEYESFVKTALAKKLHYKPKLRAWLADNIEDVLSVYLLDFEPVSELLRELYSHKKIGKAPYDPQIIIRSLLFMLLFKETSITAWVDELGNNDLLKILCGIEGKKTPCVGAYYLFLQRLEDGCYEPPCKHRVLSSEQREARKRAPKDYQNKPADSTSHKQQPETGVIARFTEALESRKHEPIIESLEKRLNVILQKVAVRPSIEKNFILNPEQIALAGDGSTIPSGANENGKALCDCRRQGIYKCDHQRMFSDPDAAWGWDTREDKFIFGYKYFHLVYGSNKHDLPVYVTIDSANISEVKLALTAVEHWLKINRDLGTSVRLDRLALDSLYDMYPVYKYLVDKDIRYAIPYKQEPAKCIVLGTDERLFTKDGVPLCPGNDPMRAHGYDKQGRRIYACPVKRLARIDGKKVYVTHEDECPLGSICEPDSTIGPIVHVEKNIDHRIHPAILRNSPEYKELSNLRSACERSNSMKKCRFMMGRPQTRIMPIAMTKLVLISILEHSKVWARAKIQDMDFKTVDVLTLF